MKHSIGKGSFLIASPSLRDPNFRRTVVLICEHSHQGALGLVINRPTEIKLKDVLPDFPDLPETLVAYAGGPVQPNHLLIIHRLEAQVPGAIEICDGMYLGGEFPILKKLLHAVDHNADGDGTFRVYLGYAGWGPKQLEFELSMGSWIVCPADAKFTLQTDYKVIWRNVLQAMGGKYALIAQMPPDPNMN